MIYTVIARRKAPRQSHKDVPSS